MRKSKKPLRSVKSLKPHASSAEALVAHALRTLPDSIRARRPLLAACAIVLPVGHPLRKHVVEMLRTLIEHDRLQQLLDLGGVS